MEQNQAFYRYFLSVGNAQFFERSGEFVVAASEWGIAQLNAQDLNWGFLAEEAGRRREICLEKADRAVRGAE